MHTVYASIRADLRVDITNFIRVHPTLHDPGLRDIRTAVRLPPPFLSLRF
jgi:hypothetical protein